MPTSSGKTVPVPIPDPIAARIGACMPIHVLQAEVDAESAAREIRRFRPLASVEDRADRESALSELAVANKVLAAYNPRLILTSRGGRS